MEKEIIRNFDTDDTKFLSNCYQNTHNSYENKQKIVIMYMNLEFDNVESAYFAAKCKNFADGIRFQNISPIQARQFFIQNAFEKKENWEKIKFRIMYDLVWQKFNNNEYLRQRLLATQDAAIYFENDFCETYWGVYQGKGENHLGEILMRVRNAIR